MEAKAAQLFTILGSTEDILETGPLSSAWYNFTLKTSN